MTCNVFGGMLNLALSICPAFRVPTAGCRTFSSRPTQYCYMLPGCTFCINCQNCPYYRHFFV